MERFSRSNKQAPQRAPQAAPQQVAPTPSPMQEVARPSVASKLLIISLIIASLVITASLGVGLFKTTKTQESLVKEAQYQAVFLANGQVYFGRLSDINKPYVRLHDIYYLQVEQQIQPDQQDPNAPVDQNSQAQQRISLAKLGNELHGPEDMMFIDRGQIVFWENLKDEGQVANAIADYVNGQQEANATDQGN